jgi:hypothetical protein
MAPEIAGAVTDASQAPAAPAPGGTGM